MESSQFRSVILQQCWCDIIEWRGLLGGGAIAATVIVNGSILAGASRVQHCHMCWPDFQCGTDPSMYPWGWGIRTYCI